MDAMNITVFIFVICECYLFHSSANCNDQHDKKRKEKKAFSFRNETSLNVPIFLLLRFSLLCAGKGLQVLKRESEGLEKQPDDSGNRGLVNANSKYKS